MVSPFSFAGKSIHLGERGCVDWSKMMAALDSKSFIATFMSDGNLQIPDEAKALLKRSGVMQVSIVFDRHGVHFFPLRMTIEDIRSSIPAVPGVSLDLDKEIEEAVEEAMIQKYGRFVHADDSEDENGD